MIVDIEKEKVLYIRPMYVWWIALQSLNQLDIDFISISFRIAYILMILLLRAHQ